MESSRDIALEVSHEPSDSRSPDEARTTPTPSVLASLDITNGAFGARIVARLSSKVRHQERREVGRDESALTLELADTDLRAFRKPARFARGIVRDVDVVAKGGAASLRIDASANSEFRVLEFSDPYRLVVDVSPSSSAERGRARQVSRIALDPGHGGADTGAVGSTGAREKDVALDIAHRAGALLAEELRIETLLTRDGDFEVALEERAARANAFGADLFVSIHCNAESTRGARGVQTFFLGKTNLSKRQAFLSELVERENGQGKGMSPTFDATSFELPNEVAAESMHLSQLLQRAALASVESKFGRPRDHGIRPAAFEVLAGANMPSVLFETAFITTKEDEALLLSSSYRQGLANGIVNAVRAYKLGK